jgi:hypothetical protein
VRDSHKWREGRDGVAAARGEKKKDRAWTARSCVGSACLSSACYDHTVGDVQPIHLLEIHYNVSRTKPKPNINENKKVLEK